MVVIKFCGVIIHNLLGGLDSIMMLESWSWVVSIWLIIRMVLSLHEQVLDSTSPDSPLIYGKAGSKLLVLADTDLIQQIHSKILAVVVDEVVAWLFLPHVEDCHLT